MAQRNVPGPVSSPPVQQKPIYGQMAKRGDWVEYVAPDRRPCTALVVQAWDDSPVVNLIIFADPIESQEVMGRERSLTPLASFAWYASQVPQQDQRPEAFTTHSWRWQATVRDADGRDAAKTVIIPTTSSIRPQPQSPEDYQRGVVVDRPMPKVDDLTPAFATPAPLVTAPS